MLFNSIEFCIFYPIVFILYWISFGKKIKFQNLLLLIASYIFYGAWDWRFLSLILFSTVVDYVIGLKLAKENESSKRKVLLILSLVTNLGLLGFFKYFNFFIDNFVAVYTLFGKSIQPRTLNIIVPVGISFYTFQTLSYSIDIYKRKLEPTKSFIDFATFVAFFPQLVAGPIERASNLLPQFSVERKFNYDKVSNGLKLVSWGLFKKVVIADRLAIVVNQVYSDPTNYEGLALIIATVFFAFQIYCDFSGYSDIAIGIAQTLGFKLMDNFNRPYFSKSVSEFWKRWHISLSTWFRDYVYIPLGGNRGSKSRWYFNLMITFIVSGLWHGASWTFIIWGALNGFYQVFGIWTKHIRKQIKDKIGFSAHKTADKYWRVGVTFCLICFAWIFFRANTIQDATYISKHLLTGITKWTNFNYIYTTLAGIGLSKKEFIIAILSILFMEGVHLLQRHDGIRYMLSKKPLWVRWSIYYAIVIGIIFFGVYGQDQFIYFQF